MCIPKLSKLSQKQASCVFKNVEALVITKNCKNFLNILKRCTEIYFSHYKLCENELNGNCCLQNQLQDDGAQSGIGKAATDMGMSSGMGNQVSHNSV
jgi:hypothetical protein